MLAGSIGRPFLVRPRLIGAVALGAVAWPVWPAALATATRVILSMDLGGVVFLLLTWVMMGRATHERMRLRARRQDEGRLTILAMTVGAAVFSLAAITVELGGIHDLPPPRMAVHIGLAAGSIVCSWLVTHTMFALHYAHGFYGDRPGSTDHAGGLEFPGETHPDYWDFLYFAFVIGMTCQTSDVALSGRSMRRLALAQGVLAFFFNTVILALSINIAAGLL